jgi:hypothetical protein
MIDDHSCGLGGIAVCRLVGRALVAPGWHEAGTPRLACCVRTFSVCMSVCVCCVCAHCLMTSLFSDPLPCNFTILCANTQTPSHLIPWQVTQPLPTSHSLPSHPLALPPLAGEGGVLPTIPLPQLSLPAPWPL